MSLNDRTTFIADTKKLIEDTEAAKIEIVDLTIKQKMEKGQISIENDEKQDEVGNEKRLVKNFKIKHEFLD